MLKLIADATVPKSSSGYISGRKSIKRILKHLDKLSTDSSDLQNLDDFYQTSRNFTYSRKTFPPLPGPNEPMHLIDRFVENITTTKYAGKLYNEAKMTPEQALESLLATNQLSEESINVAIQFYARIGDPAAILDLINRLDPQQSHFNHWLYSLYSQRRYHPENYQLKAVLPILAAMGDSQINANAQTWNNTLMAMPSHYGLGTIYGEMYQREIPLDKEAANLVTRCVLSLHGVDKVVEHLREEQKLMDRQMLHAILNSMLTTAKPDNANVLQAFDFLNYWAAQGIPPNKSTLNIFLYQFSRRNHLDWMIGISEFFNKEFGVSMTSKSWEYMLYAASRLNESPAKYQMVGMIIHEANKLALTENAKHSIKLASRFAEKSENQITSPGQHVWRYLQSELNWEKWSGPPDYSRDLEAAKAAGAMGFTSEKPTVPMRKIEMKDLGIHIEKLKT